MKTKEPFVFVVVATLCVATVSAYAQVPNAMLQERIAVTARPSLDSVVLRWAPLTYRVWRAGNENGYRIERFVLARNGHLLGQPEKVILHPSLKPLPEERWRRLVENDRYAPVAAQALYGDRFEANLKEGDIFTIVNKARENDQRFAFALFCADMSPATARASGLWFTDKQVSRGEKYLYRVVINSMDSLRGNVFLSADDPYLLPKPQNLKADFEDQLVSLRWDRNESINYSAYVLERSEDGRHFSLVSDAVMLTVSPGENNDTRYEYAVDSLNERSGIYYYRIKGITPFGEQSPPSDIVSGKSITAVSQPPYIASVENRDNTSLDIAWTFSKENESAIKGFEVERASKPGERPSQLTPDLLPPHARRFTDTRPNTVNYYRVVAIGHDDEAYQSQVYFAETIDSIAPMRPAGLHASVDDHGDVTLTWQRNKEEDIYGYRVYKAFHESEELAQVTSEPLKESYYHDHLDLNTLNRKVFYSVMAVDRSQNHSGLSPLLEVALPDKVRPQAPVLLPVESSGSGVILRWVPGGSEDIAQYAVYRKSGSGPDWQRIAILPAANDTLFAFTDTATGEGETNVYTILSIDEAGLESEPSATAAGSKLKSTLAEAVTWRKPIVNREENKITVRWRYDGQRPSKFRIFRAVDHQPPVQLTTVDAGESELTDTLVPGRHYVYRIMAVFENGSQSSLSKEMVFQY
ncbi:MAG TPA: hypothetical protein VF490_15665 [Chryseosolibacter sp.]